MEKVISKVKNNDAYKVEQTFDASGDGEDQELGSLVGGLFTLVF